MQRPARTSYVRLTTAMLVPLAALLALYYASGGDLSSLGGQSLRLTVDAPSKVALSARATELPLTLKLTNRTGSTIQLSAADPCKVLRWALQAPGDRFIQSKGNDCQPDETARPIASGEVIERSETIRLDTARLKAGETYTVFVQFYGQDATASFTATE